MPREADGGSVNPWQTAIEAKTANHMFERAIFSFQFLEEESKAFNIRSGIRSFDGVSSVSKWILDGVEFERLQR